METPGTVLRSERESQKKSLKDVAKHLKIKSDYLKAIEEDNYSLLPAEVFTKAYIRFYAESLGLESEYIIELYKQQVEVEAEASVPHSDNGTEPAEAASESTRTFNWKLTAVPAVLAVIVLSLFLITRNDDSVPPQPAPPQEKIDTEPVPEAAPEKLRLHIEATEITWVSVIADDEGPKEWLLRTGETISVTAREKFALKIGNAGGTRLILNDRDMGTLGPRGKIVDMVLTDNSGSMR